MGARGRRSGALLALVGVLLLCGLAAAAAQEGDDEYTFYRQSDYSYYGLSGLGADEGDGGESPAPPPAAPAPASPGPSPLPTPK